MHHGIDFVTLGDLGDPRVVIQLAVMAESAGWEGLFVWDHLGCVWRAPAGDPCVILINCCPYYQRRYCGHAPAPSATARPGSYAG
jgi:alkanesulfonate monooxygenase SsuD/methylene tetrahydromethanopterin reductase-like flavin-dependent oxidoreductase (luciferase family)